VNTKVADQYVTQHSFANQLTVSLITKRSTLLNGAYETKQPYPLRPILGLYD